MALFPKPWHYMLNHGIMLNHDMHDIIC